MLLVPVPHDSCFCLRSRQRELEHVRRQKQGMHPPKQPWNPPRRGTAGESSVGVKNLNPSAQLPQHCCAAELMEGVQRLNVLSPSCASSSGSPVWLSTLPGDPFMGLHQLGGLGEPLHSPPDQVTWDGLVGSSAKDFFHRVSIDGEFLPACPICLCGLHIHKGLLVNGHDLCVEAQSPACLHPHPELSPLDRELGHLLHASMARRPWCHLSTRPLSPAVGHGFGIGNIYSPCT